MSPLYRGSLKHKDRPSTGRKGTLCPEWTHAAGDQGFSGKPELHPWEKTVAHELFVRATISTNDRRYVTDRGIAFEAKPTEDGTWHGYPIPWESVPHNVLSQWLGEGKVSRRDIRLNKSRETSDIRWALSSDEP